MHTLIANIKKAIRDNEIVSIGGGDFEAVELGQIIDLYNAATQAKDALAFLWGGEPLSSLEKQALDKLTKLLG